MEKLPQKEPLQRHYQIIKLLKHTGGVNTGFTFLPLANFLYILRVVQVGLPWVNSYIFKGIPAFV